MVAKPQRNTDTTVRIRQAALQLFAKRGYEATGIRDIASESGLSLSTLYHYVDSKEELLLEIAVRSMYVLQGAADEALEGKVSPGERLEALVRAHVLVHGRIQLESLVSDLELRAMSKANRRKVVRMRDVYEVMWQEVLDEGVAAGEFRASDTHLVRLGLLQMCTGVAYWYSPGGKRSIEEIAETFAELAIAAASRSSERQPANAPTR